MTSSEAVEHLGALVERSLVLEKSHRNDEKFKKWQNDARAAFRRLFPIDTDYVQRFNAIRYFSAGVTTTVQQDFAAGVASARALLASAADEIRSFGLKSESLTSGPISQSQGSLETVFVIHGRQLVAEFHTFLRAVGLKPLEWAQARARVGKPNPYTWEVVDWALTNAGAIVALMTPDDEARLAALLWTEQENSLEKEFLGQPRQNVLFEAGVAYGRCPDRTLLIRVGSHRPMSDLAGHHILSLSNSPESRQSVVDALRAAGCPVDTSGVDWFRAGNFDM